MDDMAIEQITDRILIEWNSFDANVVVDGVVIKEFRNHELSYQRANRLAMDEMFKHMRQGW